MNLKNRYISLFYFLQIRCLKTFIKVVKWHSSFLRISHSQRWSLVIGKFHQRKFNDRSFVYYRMVAFHSDVFSHLTSLVIVYSLCESCALTFLILPRDHVIKDQVIEGLCVISNLVRWWWWRSAFVVSLTDERSLALFLAWINVRDPYSGESPTHSEHDLNLRRTRAQDLLNEVVQ